MLDLERPNLTAAEAGTIRLLGDPTLREIASRVESFDEPGFTLERRRLDATLRDFRRKHGFGRAISAPQIGFSKRLIAIRLNGNRYFIVNPEITWHSPERFTMWDDCMSFPSLLVRVERSCSISIHFQDESGRHQDWERLDMATSELLQHEIDHLNGVLAIDRAIDRESIILRETYSAMPEHFRKLVDYEIAA
jgi:peptide deformylase